MAKRSNVSSKGVAPVSNNRENTLELTVAAIERQFGKGSIMRLGEEGAAIQAHPVIPTGSLGLDIAVRHASQHAFVPLPPAHRLFGCVLPCVCGSIQVWLT